MLCSGADDPDQILEKIRENVAGQLAKSANYSCTETLVRSYYRLAGPVPMSCQSPSPAPARKQFAHDQLRLDIAVSKDAELYSWHGENDFSSKRVSDIVETGPISSGGFVGYLQNIFLGHGIRFSYTGDSSLDGKPAYDFDFVVTKPHSSYTVLTGSEYQVVPFHGSFAASAADLQLVRLKVIPDDLPFGSNLCSAQTEINYQLAPISGRAALIPESFELSVDDDQHIFTVSKGQYQQCHEFRAESTLHFDFGDGGASSTPVEAKPVRRIAPGALMHLSMITPINDQNSYAGDPVDAVLLAPVQLPDSQDMLPQGAKLHGVITQFDMRFEPADHFYLKIVFDRATAGNQSYVLRAVHKATEKEMNKISSLFGGIVPKQIMKELKNGTMVIPGKRLTLGDRFKGEWDTVAIEAHERSDSDSAKSN
jgi:hypothetical protein